jgi:hypothetical protein
MTSPFYFLSDYDISVSGLAKDGCSAFNLKVDK